MAIDLAAGLRRRLSIILFGLLTLSPAAGARADGWSTHAGNLHHTALSTVAAQPLEAIHWATPVDLAPPSGEILIHYGSPLVTVANTVIVPVEAGGGGFMVKAFSARDGSLIWSQTSDYILPPHNWTPSYGPALVGNRFYFPGAGGTVYFRDNADSAAPGATGQLAFFGMASYTANPAGFNRRVFINTPITPDSAGNIYFGFRVSGNAPLGLTSGIARIGANGNGTWVSAVGASGGDPDITRVPHQAAPVLSNDEQTLYAVVSSDSVSTNRYLVGLDPATLALKESSPGVKMRVALKDPRSGGANNAVVTDDSSATPMVGPDGDVYYGVLGNPFNGSRGWMLHFSGDLTEVKTPGAFGWDNTASIVPANSVPSYTGTSPYLIFTKYNNYAGLDGGDGVNRVAVLDPNDTMVEPHASSNGLLVMKEILSVVGPTPDPDFTAQYPNAVREWCINTAAVDPFTASVMVNSEDGKLYRWDLTTNQLSQTITLSAGVGEAYTPTAIGADGTVYAINFGILNAVGRAPSLSINDVSVAEGNSGTTDATFTVTLSTSSAQTVTVNYATADGTASAGSDYTAASGTLTFMPGETTKQLTVSVIGDTINEPDETFFVRLSSPSNATIADGEGVGTIRNDDNLPSLSIADASVVEGNSGTTNAAFVVTLSAPSGETVTVHYATSNGTAKAGSDYQVTSGTLTFNLGETTKTILVPVIGDRRKEPDETFFVTLSSPSNANVVRAVGLGTILDDDSIPALSISDVSKKEGSSGTTDFVFVVTRSGATGRTATVHFATANGTARAGSDYTPTSGSLTFAPGEKIKTITVSVIGDTVKERNETFFARLSKPVNARITKGQGRGTILNDD